ncbi:hypothetical protein, partial [Brevundimonas naejangsanensis]|uniref:hypothetical protein n=1 Tax=Brevundimonas naejangsanensis TaxID=588932 RepID=UPI0026F1D176
VELDHRLGPPDRRHPTVQFLKPLNIRSQFLSTTCIEHPNRSPFRITAMDWISLWITKALEKFHLRCLQSQVEI